MESGFPTKDQVTQVLKSKDFQFLRESSEEFYRNNEEHLASYFSKWGREPMKNWSRQYEYPYVEAEIKKYLGSLQEPAQILDAGSGCSFFPYFLANQYFNCDMHCTDYDPELELIYENLNRGHEKAVIFSRGDLRELPYSSNQFELIYCISVLEHTDSYEQIVREFERVLKPGGLLILTMDVAVDGANDIPPETAENLVSTVNQLFQPNFPHTPLVETLKATKDRLLTTKWSRDNDYGVLPWKYIHLSALKAGWKHGKLSLFPYLTVYCGSWKKSA